MRYTRSLILAVALIGLLAIQSTYAAEAPPPGPSVTSPAAPAPAPTPGATVDGRKEDEEAERSELAGKTVEEYLERFKDGDAGVSGLEAIAQRLAKEQREIVIARSLLAAVNDINSFIEALNTYGQSMDTFNDAMEAMTEDARLIRARNKELETALAEQMARSGALAKGNRDLQRKIDDLERQRKHGA